MIALTIPCPHLFYHFHRDTDSIPAPLRLYFPLQSSLHASPIAREGARSLADLLSDSDDEGGNKKGLEGGDGDEVALDEEVISDSEDDLLETLLSNNASAGRKGSSGTTTMKTIEVERDMNGGWAGGGTVPLNSLKAKGMPGSQAIPQHSDDDLKERFSGMRIKNRLINSFQMDEACAGRTVSNRLASWVDCMIYVHGGGCTWCR